jgi:hypothetical protein
MLGLRDGLKRWVVGRTSFKLQIVLKIPQMVSTVVYNSTLCSTLQLDSSEVYYQEMGYRSPSVQDRADILLLREGGCMTKAKRDLDLGQRGRPSWLASQDAAVTQRLSRLPMQVQKHERRRSSFNSSTQLSYVGWRD